MGNLNLMDILKQVQNVQSELEKIKKELAYKKVTAASGGGMVEATANGRQRIVDIKIEPELLEQNDKEMIEDLIVAAVNLALEESAKLANQELNKAAGGILGNLPEGIKIPGFNL